MDDLTTSLQKLKVAEAKDEDIATVFVDLIDKIESEDDSTEICEKLGDAELLQHVRASLDAGASRAARAAQLTAELAKVESVRSACVEAGLVQRLVACMASEEAQLALHACRALGNICYEHDGGRVAVLQAKGTEQLLALLRRLLGSGKGETASEQHQLRLVATGFLLNLLNSYEATQDVAVEDGLVDVLCGYLATYVEEEDIPTHVLLTFSCMADSESGLTVLEQHDLSSHLVAVLKKNSSPEVIETCLELITSLAESEEAKTALTKGGVVDAVVSVVQQHRDSPNPDLSLPIVKAATDVTVLILVGDESMRLLYADGAGEVYKELVSWLSDKDEELQIAGALAMGNFARSDTHCLQMVAGGVAEQLLKLLAQHNHENGDIRLQHALLSALRNLSIAQQNKQRLVTSGCLDVLMPMTQSVQTFPVVFKLLATLRMVVDGQEAVAVKVGSFPNMLSRLASWSKTMEHPGVQGEASRLIAWLVKNAKAEVVSAAVLDQNCLPPLVLLLSSEHHVMVSEASLALAILTCTSSTLCSKLTTQLKELPGSLDGLAAALTNPNLPPEVLCNLLAFSNAMAEKDSALLRQSDAVCQAAQSLAKHSHEEVCGRAATLEKLLKKEEKPQEEQKE